MGIAKPGCVHARTCDARGGAAPGIFECTEVMYNRAGIHSALGDLSPAELEEANWPEGEGRPKAA